MFVYSSVPPLQVKGIFNEILMNRYVRLTSIILFNYIYIWENAIVIEAISNYEEYLGILGRNSE